MLYLFILLKISLVTCDSLEISEVLYSNLGNVKELFAISDDESPDSPDPPSPTKLGANWLTELSPDVHLEDIPLPNTNSKLYDHDIRRFNEITGIARTATRRWRDRLMYVDQEESKWLKYSMVEERSKRSKLRNMTFQLLIHTRYKIKKALIQRQPFRGHIAYRLGFLFHRIRTVNNHQFQLVNVAYIDDDTYYSNLTTLVRNYEKCLRLEVDVRDTYDHITAMHRAALLTSTTRS